MQDFSKTRVLVAGDVMLDIYRRAAALRISPSAPVPGVFEQSYEVNIGKTGNVDAGAYAKQRGHLLDQNSALSYPHRVKGGLNNKKLRWCPPRRTVLGHQYHSSAWAQGVNVEQVAIYFYYANGSHATCAGMRMLVRSICQYSGF